MGTVQPKILCYLDYTLSYLERIFGKGHWLIIFRAKVVVVTCFHFVICVPF